MVPKTKHWGDLTGPRCVVTRLSLCTATHGARKIHGGNFHCRLRCRLRQPYCLHYEAPPLTQQLVVGGKGAGRDGEVGLVSSRSPRGNWSPSKWPQVNPSLVSQQQTDVFGSNK